MEANTSVMARNEVLGYQFAERIKSELIIGSKMLAVIESLDGSELEGAKKMLAAFFDALAIDAGMALKATGNPEFAMVEEKLNQIQRNIDAADYQEAQATIGQSVSHATTVCARTMTALIEKGLI
jgi:hypothetical protein